MSRLSFVVLVVVAYLFVLNECIPKELLVLLTIRSVADLWACRLDLVRIFKGLVRSAVGAAVVSQTPIFVLLIVSDLLYISLWPMQSVTASSLIIRQR
jgi:hypothetical protein